MEKYILFSLKNPERLVRDFLDMAPVNFFIIYRYKNYLLLS